VYPLRLFVTFIHELGHGVTAEVTGGDFISFEVKSSGAGVAFSRGGVRPAIISAGYVGTAIFGAVLLLAANRVTQPRHIAFGLGTAFITLTLFYSGLGLSNFNALEALLTLAVMGGAGFVFVAMQQKWIAAVVLAMGIGLLLIFAAGGNLLTLLVGVVSGILLIVLGYFARDDAIRFVLNFLAFAVGLNAISDGWVLLQVASNPELVSGNDASSMAAEVGLPAALWALVWIVLAILLLGLSAWATLIRPARQTEGVPDA
jgi:hypothetical protein